MKHSFCRVCQLYGGATEASDIAGSEVMSAQKRSEIVSRKLAFSLHYKSQQLRRLSCILSMQLQIVMLCYGEVLWAGGMLNLTQSINLTVCVVAYYFCTRPSWGRGTPLPPLSIYFLIFSPFYFFLSFIGFTYFLLLSIPSLSTRIVPLCFQAGGRSRRPNLGLVCVLLCNLCYLYSLVKMDCGVLFYLD